MDAVVLIKQVPDDPTIYLDRDSGRLRRETTGVQADPASRAALELALQVRERGTISKITVLTLGPERAVEVLRQALAMGADAACHLMDAAFAGSDVLATARTILAGVHHTGGGIVFLGEGSADGRMGVLGPMLAEALGYHFEVWSPPDALPGAASVVAVPADAVTPRTPKALQVMRASKIPITTFDAAGLGLTTAQVGQAGSGTEVVRSEKVVQAE